MLAEHSIPRSRGLRSGSPSCEISRSGVVLEESRTRATVPAGSHRTVLATSFGLTVAGTWPVQLRCYKESGNGSFQATNIQLTAIKVATLN